MFLIFYKNLVKQAMSNHKLIILIVLLIGLLAGIFYFEHKSNGETFGNLQDLIWWGFITSTTIGYGDKFPITIPGQWLTMIYVLFSLGVLGEIISRATNSLLNNKLRKMNGEITTKFKNHIIVSGLPNMETYDVIKQFFGENEKEQIVYLGSVDKMPKEIEIMQSKGFKVDFVNGNFGDDDILDKINIKEARIVVLLSEVNEVKGDAMTISHILTIRESNKDVYIIAEINRGKKAKLFKEAGANKTINTTAIGKQLMVRSVTDDVDTVIGELLDNKFGYEIYSFKVTDDAYTNKTFGELKQGSASKSHQVLCVKDTENNTHYENSYSMKKGDSIFYIAEDKLSVL